MFWEPGCLPSHNPHPSFLWSTQYMPPQSRPLRPFGFVALHAMQSDNSPPVLPASLQTFANCPGAHPGWPVWRDRINSGPGCVRIQWKDNVELEWYCRRTKSFVQYHAGHPRDPPHRLGRFYPAPYPDRTVFAKIYCWTERLIWDDFYFLHNFIKISSFWYYVT